MLSRYSVKKPYTVVVAVLLVIILGVIAFTRMTTDLLPSMNFPYVIVYTTYVGATPEQVETEVTRPMESAFATLTDIKEINSQSRDNVSMVVLQFNDTADMNTAMIEINSQITTLQAGWDDAIGAPAILKINPDMLPVTIVSVARDGMDIIELSEYVENELIPEYESINGVARVTANGLITQEVDVTIEQDRIDVLNEAILRDIDAELADVGQQLDDAESQIADGRSQLSRMRASTLAQIDAGLRQLDDAPTMMTGAVTDLTAKRDELQTQLDQINAALPALEALTGLSDDDLARLQAFESQIGTLLGQKDEVLSQLDSLAAGEGSEALEGQRESAVTERDALQQQRDSLQNYLTDLDEADPDVLASDIAALDGQIAEAETSLADAVSERDAASAALAGSKARIAEIQAALGTAAAQPGETTTVAPDATAAADASSAPSQTQSSEATAAPSSSGAPADTAAPSATDAPTEQPEATLAPGVPADEPITSDDPTPPAEPTEPSGLTASPSEATPDPASGNDAPAEPVSGDEPVSETAALSSSSEPTLVPVAPDEPLDDSGETEPTDEAPAPTEAPSPTDTSVVTEAAAVTEAPVLTGTPSSTDTPAPTDAPAAQPPADPGSDDPSVPADEPLSAFALRHRASAEEPSEAVLREELASLEAGLAAQETALSDAEAAVTKRQAALDALTEARDAKQSALDSLGDGSTETRRQAAQREIDQLDRRIGLLDLEIDGIDLLLSGDPAAVDALKATIEAIDAEIGDIESSDEYQALHQAISGSSQDVADRYAAAVQGKAQLEAGIAQIDSTIDKLNAGIIPGGMFPGVDQDMTVDDAKTMLSNARSTAVSAFDDAASQLSDAEGQIAEARKTFEDQRDEALKNAGFDGIITVQTVAGLIGAQNMSMPAGYVYDVSGDEYLVRVGDKFTALEDLKTMKLFHVGTESIDDVRLLDVADVQLTDNRSEAFTKVDGQDGILLSIEKQSTFSTTDVSRAVAAKNAELIGTVDGLSIVDLFNQGDYITIIVNSVLQNLVWGGLLAVLVLLIFLLDWRPTIIIAFSIPISVVAAFVCMYFSGITLNVLSLSGLALGIGMLVDNSIVAIENIYRLHDEEGMPILQACVQGVKSITGALVASTATTICVFLPVLFVTGMAHDLFIDIGLTIAFSLIASLVVAMTLVPSMAAGLVSRSKPRKHSLFRGLQRGYVAMLRGALKVKPLVLLAAVGLLVFMAMQVPKMGISFMPTVNSTQMTAEMDIDPEEDIEPQHDRALELMTRMGEIEGIQSVGLSGASTLSSLSGSDSLSYYIIVDENAGHANADIAAEIRGLAEEMELPLSVSASTMDISMMTGNGVSVDITGAETDVLRQIASDVAGIVSGVEGTADVSDGLEASVPEIRVTVDKEKAAEHNLTVGQVLQFVATKLAGKTRISSATLDGKDLDIYLVDGRNADITPRMLEDLSMEVTSGNLSEMVRIGDVADIQDAMSLTSIRRERQQRVISVTFQAAEGYSLNHVSDEVAARLAEYDLPEGYDISLSGENETVMGIMNDLVFMVVIAIVLIFLIMVAQFQSFKSPIIVMFTIPLAFTGGLAALLITGMDLSIVAMVGFLVLSGVVVNNGIVFVDSVNQLRIGGMSKRDALLETGRLRLRPILMTAATTILGMSTMALGTGMGAEMMQPMAVVTIGGLTYATLMTLFIVPVLYDLVNGQTMKAREIDMIREAAGLNPPEEAPRASAPIPPKDPDPAPNASEADPTPADSAPEGASAQPVPTDAGSSAGQTVPDTADPAPGAAQPTRPETAPGPLSTPSGRRWIATTPPPATGDAPWTPAPKKPERRWIPTQFPGGR